MSLNSKDRALVSRCRTIIAGEMRSYDYLSRSSRLRYEAHVQSCVDEGLFAEKTFTCAHGVLLYEECAKCGRSQEDCVVYAQLAQSRLKELLSLLGGK